MKKTSTKPNPAWINAFQRNVLEQYDRGEYLYLLDLPSEAAFDEGVSNTGDGLFRFVISEMSASADCDSIDEAINRLDNASNQLSQLNGALHSMLIAEPA
jgi:hypothetical protein